MSVFGNGVLEGWEASQEEAFVISISSGSGNINFVSARTNFSTALIGFVPDSISYIYVKKTADTNFSENVEFSIRTSDIILDPNFLLLSKITTNATTITEIDNSVRQSIGFLEIIKAAVKTHRHRGGSLYPSKIDLATEVKGQLPSFRIADFDAEKITTGTFDLSRLPYLSHQDLLNVGLLTHPQLDSFVKTLEASNKEIFGEISTANLLQLIIAMKLIHDDPDSTLYTGSLVGKNFINEFAIIPGITPNNFIDFDSTTATVNLVDHYIEGIPSTTGSSFYARYDTDSAWKSSYTVTDLAISNDTVTLAFNESEETSTITIEGFESATVSGEDLSGGGTQTLFKKEIVIISDGAKVTANDSETNVIEGFYSGKFTAQQSFRVRYVKEWTSEQDWSTYDAMVLWIKCINEVHGQVKMYLEGSGENDQTIEYILLENNITTSNPDPATNEFEARWIDLTTVPFRNRITKIIIYTDDLINPFSFYVDYISIQRAVLLPEEGTMIIRYSSSSKLTFASLEWNSSEPGGSSITVRARAADGTAFLNRATYTPYIDSGNIINLEGTDLEIEIKFYPDTDRIVAPVLIWLRILMIANAEIDGFKIDTPEEFNRGDLKNINVTDDRTELDIPVFVDSYYFALANTVNQVHATTTSGVTVTESDDVAMFGTDSPIAPNTIFASVESLTGETASARFFEPRCIRRLDGRTFVIADTYNDRVLEYDENGVLIAGFGSINYEHDTKLFPLSACFDSRTSILYIVWSRSISFKTVDVSKITIQNSTRQIKLVSNFDKIMGLTTDELDAVNAEGQILPIYLCAQNASSVKNLPSGGNSFIMIPDTAISSGMDASSEFYKKIYTALGIPIFVGNFAYISGIFTPTWADKTDLGTYVICNGKVAVKDWKFTSTTETIKLNSNVSSIVEVDKNNNIIFAVDNIQFSPFIPGRAMRIDNHTMLIGGLKNGGVLGAPTTGKLFDFRSIGGVSSIRQSQKSVLNEMFFTTAPTPFVGVAVLYDTLSNGISFEYRSPEGLLVSDVDIDLLTGNYIIAESSFSNSGRVIKLDVYGNIEYSFGEGIYSIISSVRSQLDGSMIIST